MISLLDLPKMKSISLNNVVFPLSDPPYITLQPFMNEIRAGFLPLPLASNSFI